MTSWSNALSLHQQQLSSTTRSFALTLYNSHRESFPVYSSYNSSRNVQLLQHDLIILCVVLFFSVGYYLYLESSYPARFGYKSQLMSPSFGPLEERCLSWWYSMNGRTVGSLSVYLINSVLGTKTRLWSKSGEQGKDWRQAFASLNSDWQYRVRGYVVFFENSPFL